MKKDKILIHICCAPDACYSIPALRKDYEPCGLFYNPNIQPREEYEKRLAHVVRLANIQKWPLREGKYETVRWQEAVKGCEDLGEHSRRCFLCIRNSLLYTAAGTAGTGIKYFTTTLTNSPRKSIKMIEEAAAEAENATGAVYVRTDFKKRDGYLRSTRISKILGIYRQNYCGCLYSLREKIDE